MRKKSGGRKPWFKNRESDFGDNEDRPEVYTF